MWKTKTQIINEKSNKKLVFWGTGEWVEKTIKAIGCTPDFIVDINPNTHNILFKGFLVKSPEVIKNLPGNYYVVITTGSYLSVVTTLKEYGYQDVDFCCSPSLKNLSIKNNLLNINKNLLFTVPNTPSEGGGVYLYNTKEKLSKKIFEGKSRAIVKSHKNYYLVDEMEGLIGFDENFKIIKKAELLANSIPHGIAYCDKNHEIFVANSGRDSVSVFDAEKFTHKEEIRISGKSLVENEEQHHINDLWVVGNSLFISMFSFTGNWRNNIYDGGVLEYNLKEKKFIGPIISDLWMPHTIKIIDNKTYIVDSMRSRLIEMPNKTVGLFPGFVRGFDYDGEYFYVAQSENRYFDRLAGESYNVQCNSGIHIFDPITKASRFHAIDMFENIHSVILIDESSI